MNDFTPLIGIVTSRKLNGTIGGNGPLFLALQKKLISLNGISFVFTPEDVSEEYINGYTFFPEENQWRKARFPYPDLVYNRIPFRKSEKEENSQKLFSILKEKNIPFFNPCFIDKYELFQLLKKDSSIAQYLPETILVKNEKDLFHFLKKFKGIYLKPVQSSKGKGIFRIRMDSHSELLLEGINRHTRYPSFTHFWNEWNEELLLKTYIAQEEILSAEYEGTRFDFRILAHANQEEYILTGVGVRLSQKQDVTTHIPSGGRLIPYQQLQSNDHDEFFQTIVSKVGHAITAHIGYFGEFSIDAGLSQTGRYYIFEVNSKPMSFDEIEIEESKIENLCKLFLQLINQKKMHENLPYLEN
ncbi:YheC/YheD family protein [Neobacillus cucumis]|uniref:YheC/YheD family endospore coat-associated protein n=1 Tax=Neobacillus cucumis TaxID=1740721 RepID=UPI002E1E6249|nr:YheC/YheD family protein [Neobacillus cucumis]